MAEDRQRGLVLKEGGWVYTSLILVGWPHVYLMRGRANLCKVFWSILLGLPLVGVGRYMNWTFAIGTPWQRLLKVAWFVLWMTLGVFLTAGAQYAFLPVVIALLMGAALGLMLGIIKVGVKVSETVKVSPLTDAVGDIGQVIVGRLAALYARLCPPILFDPREPG